MRKELATILLAAAMLGTVPTSGRNKKETHSQAHHSKKTKHRRNKNKAARQARKVNRK